MKSPPFRPVVTTPQDMFSEMVHLVTVRLRERFHTFMPDRALPRHHAVLDPHLVVVALVVDVAIRFHVDAALRGGTVRVTELRVVHLQPITLPIERPFRRFGVHTTLATTTSWE